MTDPRPLIAATADDALEQALRDKLQRRVDSAGAFGELQPLAVRLGLMQASLVPSFHLPQLMVFASDHGVALDGIASPHHPTTAQQVQAVLEGRLPLASFSQSQGMELTVVDAGIADRTQPMEGLLVRKIAHGTRNARLHPAMSLDQALAALRAGLEIADAQRGNAVAFAGLGVGSAESAAFVLSRLAGVPSRELLLSGPQMSPHRLAHLLLLAQGVNGRHRDLTDPVDVLAAVGGFEIAMMAGTMLGTARRRGLLMVDGLPACAALLVASRIDAAVLDYAVFARSHGHAGLDRALALFRASALLELGLDSVDGTGAALAWPLVNAAALLLSGMHDAVPAELEGLQVDLHVDASPGGMHTAPASPAMG